MSIETAKQNLLIAKTQENAWVMIRDNLRTELATANEGVRRAIIKHEKCSRELRALLEE